MCEARNGQSGSVAHITRSGFDFCSPVCHTVSTDQEKGNIKMVIITNGFPVEASNGDLFVIDFYLNVIFDSENNIVFKFVGFDGEMLFDEDEIVEIIESGAILEIDHITLD